MLFQEPAVHCTELWKKPGESCGMEKIEEILSRYPNQTHAFVFVDLDNFKKSMICWGIWSAIRCSLMLCRL